jgi:cellulose 1,4-beta-cellobiosidase
MRSRRFASAGGPIALALTAAVMACAQGQRVAPGSSYADDASAPLGDDGGGTSSSAIDAYGGNPGDDVVTSSSSSGGSTGGTDSSTSSSSSGGVDASTSGGEDVATSSSGSSGSSSGGVADTGPPNTGLSVLYKVNSSQVMTPYISCEFSIRNASSTPVAVSDLKLRYYFTDEYHLPFSMTIQWSHISTSGANQTLNVSYTFGTISPAVTGADSYVEFSLSSSYSMVSMNESADFSWQMNGPDQAKDVYTQSNDYSFDASKTSLTAWNHVVLLQNGGVAWGVPPQ